MGKVFIALNENAQLMLERIRIDRDPEDALEFITQVVLPQFKDQDLQRRSKMSDPSNK